MSLTRVQNGRESANLIEQIYAEDQQTIKSNSSTLEEELELLYEEVRKETNENLEWKKLQRVMELAKKKTQKDTEYANRKKQKEMELAEKRKLKELQLAEKKRQKEIEQAEKKRLREEIENLKKNKAVKQQLEISLTVSISPPLQMKQTENVDNDSASVRTFMAVTVPEATTDSKAVNKPSAVPLAVEAAAQSDPISTGENGCGMENFKEHKSKEKKSYEIYKKKDDKRENKKDINKWSSFFKQFKSYSHIDSINGSLRRVESKHTYTKKEKQQISKSKGGYVESSNINETFSINNSTKDRRDLKIKNKEQKKKKKRGNNDENVSNCAFTTVNSVSSVHQTTTTNNNEDDNVIHNTNIIPITTKASEDPIVKITSSKSKPVLVNSSHQMKRHTSISTNTSKISKNKNREIVGDNKKEDHSIINNTIIKRNTSKVSENPVVKTASITVNSSHQMKQRASNGSTASKISKSKRGKKIGDNKEDHSIIDDNIIKRSTKVRACESPVVKTASFKSASIAANSSLQMKQLTSYISLTSKISKNKIEEIVGDNNEDGSIIDNTSIQSTIKANEDPVAKTVSFKSASVMVNSSLQMEQCTSTISVASKISKNKIGVVVDDNNEDDSIHTSIQSTIKATEDSIAKTVSFKSASVMANHILQMDQRTNTSSVASKISKSNKVERVCENIRKDVSINNNTEIPSTTKANEGPTAKGESSKSAPVIVKSSHVMKRRISNISIASKISKSKKGDKVGDNINIINSIIQSIIKASEAPVVKTGSSKSTPVVNSSLLMKQPASKNSNTRKSSKSKKDNRGGDDGDSSVLNNGSQISKGLKKSEKKNESEANSKNSKTKETPSAKGSKRSTHSIVNVCSSNNQCLSKKVSVIEDDIVVKELEKIEKERLDRASGVNQSNAGDGPIAKQSLVFMARRNWKKRRSSVEEEPVVKPDDEKPENENEHERERIPCKKFLEELTSNPEHSVDVTLSHNLLVLVKLCMFYVKQSMKVMKNFCFIITNDERDPEVTCLTETVGQVVKVFWVTAKTACKCLQCEKTQRQNINEQCT